MSLPSWWVTPTVAWDPAYTDPVTGVKDWDEQADGIQPGSGMEFARDDAVATLNAEVPTAKVYAAIMAILGYAWADAVPPYAMHRVNPMCHPDHSGLRAVSVNVIGKNPLGKLVAGSVPARYSASKPATIAGTFPERTNFSRTVFSVRFRHNPYPFMSDADLVAGGLGEIYRNCSVFQTTEPTVDILAAGSKDFLKWADSPAPLGATPLIGTNNNLDGGRFSLPIPKAVFGLVWHHVPYDFIAAPYLPSKFLKCMGKVNGPLPTSPPWLGIFPPGTLRMEAPHITRAIQSHIDTTGGIIPFCADITIPFTFVDPEMALLVASATPSFRGWNALPWEETAKFYAVCRSGDTSKSLFEYADFDTVFKHVAS
jgi:hypothetical protein